MSRALQPLRAGSPALHVRGPVAPPFPRRSTHLPRWSGCRVCVCALGPAPIRVARALLARAAKPAVRAPARWLRGLPHAARPQLLWPSSTLVPARRATKPARLGPRALAVLVHWRTSAPLRPSAPCAAVRRLARRADPAECVARTRRRVHPRRQNLQQAQVLHTTPPRCLGSRGHQQVDREPVRSTLEPRANAIRCQSATTTTVSARCVVRARAASRLPAMSGLPTTHPARLTADRVAAPARPRPTGRAQFARRTQRVGWGRARYLTPAVLGVSARATAPQRAHPRPRTVEPLHTAAAIAGAVCSTPAGRTASLRSRHPRWRVPDHRLQGAAHTAGAAVRLAAKSRGWRVRHPAPEPHQPADGCTHRVCWRRSGAVPRAPTVRRARAGVWRALRCPRQPKRPPERGPPDARKQPETRLALAGGSIPAPSNLLDGVAAAVRGNRAVSACSRC